MITFEKAKQLATECIKLRQNRYKELHPDKDVELVFTRSEEFENGWFFFFSSKQFLETHNPDYRLIGLGPVIIGKENGDIYQAATGGSDEYWIDKFNEYLQSKKSK